MLIRSESWFCINILIITLNKVILTSDSESGEESWHDAKDSFEGQKYLIAKSKSSKHKSFLDFNKGESHNTQSTETVSTDEESTDGESTQEGDPKKSTETVSTETVSTETVSTDEESTDGESIQKDVQEKSESILCKKLISIFSFSIISIPLIGIIYFFIVKKFINKYSDETIFDDEDANFNSPSLSNDSETIESSDLPLSFK